MEKETLELYKDKILAIRNYKSSKSEFGISDFTDLEKLDEILLEIFSGESDITPAGKQFIIDYYSLDSLASHLLSSEYIQKRYILENKEQVVLRLKELVPMETKMFIEESRGNSMQGQTLREDLLPPTN